MKRYGLVILLYWFMLSYFGVGSLRNALGGVLPTAGERVLAVLYGLSWLTLAAGGTLALLGKPGGLLPARVSAAAAALVNCAGLAMFGTGEADMNGILFLLSRPVADGYLFLLLSRSIPADKGSGPRSVPAALPVIAAGALLPWLAWSLVRLLHGGPLALSREPGAFPVFFLSLWCALPFAVLLLAAAAWPAPAARKTVLAGGFAGTALASLYVYGLIWSQHFNVFLLAHLPPVVYAGQALGLGISSFAARRAGGRAGHTFH